MTTPGQPRIAWVRHLQAALLLAALAPAWLAAPPRSAAAAAGAGAERGGIIPDGMPYDSTRGDSVGEAALYLSWGAPWGSPGARRDVTIACDDSSRVDTLYLSIETGRDLPRLVAMFGRITLHAAPGDSLGAFWGFGEGGANRGGLVVQIDADGTFPCAQLWLYPGIGGTMYESAPGHGELLAIYAVKPDDAAPISGRTRYCFARLVLKQRRSRLDGAWQSVCIEWREGGYTGGGADILVRKGPGRFVSVNSPDGSVCVPYRSRAGVGAWRPQVQQTAPPRPPRRSAAPADTTRR
jgi:hypothetical protein